MPAPVGYTCLTIDSILNDIEEVSKMLSTIDTSNEKTQGIIDEAIHTLAPLLTRRSYIEEVRSANHELREWGEELELQLEQANKEINELESQIDQLNDELYEVRN